MRNLKVFLVLALVLLMSVAVLAGKGPVPDKVYFDVRMDENIGINDVATGNSDIFYHGVDGNIIDGLDSETLSKLEIYDIPSGTWSLQFNPYPNEEPYNFEKDGETIFNPFAIREVRFAMNFLINRQYIVDEIQGGAGGAMFTMATPGQPGTYRYNLAASKFGFTAEGDEERAIAEITAALEKAAELPGNKGRLRKEGQWWTFDGEPVIIKFYIRVDDPNGRLKAGEYISQQIEKTGIKVEKLLWDRSKSTPVVYGGKPEDWEYTIYTEGWGAGATRRYWEHIVAQMYAPWYGYMPGGLGDGWKYKNEKIDKLTQDAYNGKFLTEDEYWEFALKGLEIGLEEGIRIYLSYQTQYFVANKDRFNQRFAYGLGDGLTKYTLVTADTEDKIVRATQYSAQGSLFMGAWDPVGPDGFSDTYANNIADGLHDAPAIESPASGEYEFCGVYPLDVISNVIRDEQGNLIGQIPVSGDALRYDSVNKEWVEVGVENSFSKGIYAIRPNKYHHGIAISMVDYLYRDAFKQDWINEDYKGDPYYSAAYESYVGGMDVGVGTVYDFENNQIIEYFDFQFPASANRVAGRGAPTWSTSANNSSKGVVWEVVEALARMVMNGGVSGENYAFDAGTEGALEVDVIRPTCVADIRAELEEMIAENHVPVYIKGFITPEETVRRYQAAVDFIDDYGHAYISNGPFMITNIDFSANFVELSAFRDESYPFESDYWMDTLRTTRLQIDEMDLPAMAQMGEDILVDIYVSAVDYPNKEGEAAEIGDVQLSLITDDEEIEFKAIPARTGRFIVEIPGEVTENLEAGSYTVMGLASSEVATPSTVTATIMIY